MHRRSGVGLAFVIGLSLHPPSWSDPLDYRFDVRSILNHDDGEFLWFHPRACAIPNSDGKIVLTLQRHLHVSDFYSRLYVMHSSDGGATWTDPVAPPQLDWREESDGVTVAVCDVTPGWHEQTQKIIAIGAKVRYRDGIQRYDTPQSRAAAYAVFDTATDVWSEWQFVDMPDPEGKFFLVTPGCTQWVVENDGHVLLPIYFQEAGAERNKVTVVRCTFDGSTLRYAGHGSELSLDVERGLVEPSIAKFNGRYFLTIRNDIRAYVTTSRDGLRYDSIRPWTFDDGEELGSYNTQQHWITHEDGIFLTYTRRGADNDHIMRHRAPLFIARVDPDALHVIRATERVLIPERGATLGNFGASAISPVESWVTVSEGVWNDDARRRGATGATFIARILWNTPEKPSEY